MRAKKIIFSSKQDQCKLFVGHHFLFGEVSELAGNWQQNQFHSGSLDMRGGFPSRSGLTREGKRRKETIRTKFHQRDESFPEFYLWNIRNKASSICKCRKYVGIGGDVSHFAENFALEPSHQVEKKKKEFKKKI